MKKYLLVLALIAIWTFCFLPAVFAADNPEQATLDQAVDKINTGFGKDLVTVAATDDPSVATHGLIGRAIKIFLGIIGTIALIIFIYSGIMWMTSGGNDTVIKKAEGSMIWAAIGLFAIFVSYAIITYLIKSLAF